MYTDRAFGLVNILFEKDSYFILGDSSRTASGPEVVYSVKRRSFPWERHLLRGMPLCHQQNDDKRHLRFISSAEAKPQLALEVLLSEGQLTPSTYD
jgi:hypothetical protein